MSKGINFSATSRSGQTYSTPSFFFEALTILFIALKLTGVIGWSWWWVLAPIWAPAAIVLGFVLFVFALAALGMGTFKAVRRSQK